MEKTLKSNSKFLSTPSARRATGGARQKDRLPQFLSTPSARRATCGRELAEPQRGISIHALREEGDTHGCECG